jgi:hypothetical protein
MIDLGKALRPVITDVLRKTLWDFADSSVNVTIHNSMYLILYTALYESLRNSLAISMTVHLWENIDE